MTKKLRGLRCMLEVAAERCWQWLFHGEAASIRFPRGGYEDVPEERRPVILGRIRFPPGGGMTLETNSIPRAVAGARFFGARLGPHVKAVRCRVINRYFSSEDGRPESLLKMLDQDVTVLDPAKTERGMWKNRLNPFGENRSRLLAQVCPSAIPWEKRLD